MGLEAEQVPVGLTGVTDSGKAKENVANQNTLTKPTVMDRVAWHAALHGVTKSWTLLRE